MAAKVELKSKVKKWITNHLILQLMSMTVKKSNQMRKMTRSMLTLTYRTNVLNKSKHQTRSKPSHRSYKHSNKAQTMTMMMMTRKKFQALITLPSTQTCQYRVRLKSCSSISRGTNPRRSILILS